MKMSYYGIFIPTKSVDNDEDLSFVFTDKQEALKVLKNHKEARLKVFKNNEDAQNFTQNGFDFYGPNTNEGLNSPSIPVNIEKTPFRGPKSQELVLFRKSIENGNINLVHFTILDNPRYLVGSGDTPSILKEGPRYNAIHVCALTKNAKICDLILKTISNPDFVQLLHGKKNLVNCQEVSNILLDLYLNTPEKVRSETPLHIAAKYGAVEVVEILTSYPQCKSTPNSEGLYAKDIICLRVQNPAQSLIESIEKLLQERFYVPVIRSSDHSLLPKIGEPFSPTKLPDLKTDTLSPDLEIHAYAGPMSKDQAQVFHKRWKTPPRILTSFNNSISIQCSPVKRLNKNNSIHKPFINSTPILLKNRQLFPNKSFDNKLNLSGSVDSYDILKNESFNSNFNVADTVSYHERNIKIKDTEKGLEIIGRNLAREQNVDWKEYWKFLNCFINISSEEGLSQFENYLKKKFEEKSTKQIHFINENHNQQHDMDSLCCALNSLKIDKKVNSPQHIARTPLSTSAIIQTTISPYLCVEKSCQVFAKRIANAIIKNIDNIKTIHDVLLLELKRLHKLIFSYKSDLRFNIINYSMVHSRFTNLIVTILYNEKIITNNINKIKLHKILNNIMLNKTSNINNNNIISDETKKFYCTIMFLLNNINSKTLNIINLDNIITELDCINIWNNEIACECMWFNGNHTETKNVRINNFRYKRLDFSDSMKQPNIIYNDTSILKTQNEVAIAKTKTFDSVDVNKIQNWRSKNDSYNLDNDEIYFWSDCDLNNTYNSYNTDAGQESDDDIYYTPPDSPFNLLHDDFNSSPVFIYGNEPTKTDIDVLNALNDIVIDENIYPNICRWRIAVLDSSFEETDIKSLTTSRRLFSTPNKDVSFNTYFYLNNSNSCSFLNSSISNNNDAINVCLMDINKDA